MVGWGVDVQIGVGRVPGQLVDRVGVALQFVARRRAPRCLRGHRRLAAIDGPDMRSLIHAARCNALRASVSRHVARLAPRTCPVQFHATLWTFFLCPASSRDVALLSDSRNAWTCVSASAASGNWNMGLEHGTKAATHARPAQFGTAPGAACPGRPRAARVRRTTEPRAIGHGRRF